MAAEADPTRHDGLPEDPFPTPELTQHCIDRYDERVPAGAVSPERALLDAVPDDGIIHHPRFCGEGAEHDPTRIWCYIGRTDGEWWTVIFVDVRGVAVTCWRADEDEYPAVGAYLVARAMEGLADA